MLEHSIQLVGIIAAGIAGTYSNNSRCIIMILSNIPPLVSALIVYYVLDSQTLTRLGGVYHLFSYTISIHPSYEYGRSNFSDILRKTSAAAGSSSPTLRATWSRHSFVDSEALCYQMGSVEVCILCAGAQSDWDLAQCDIY
ncbi:Uncharacterized protein TPAR_01251 [Tolypocladium paradoxum]|uniref:Uncharacterized protein n=1 Tax=Tolypocladium paradoxum TaxID=94208 RepID=A0A2S4L7Y6_9HYPO|nr:Uncharacterized protein TPAR_01251 [Tolypocladium paradoxum]